MSAELWASAFTKLLNDGTLLIARISIRKIFGEVFICLPGNNIMDICHKYNVTCCFYVLRDMESQAIDCRII